MDRRLFLFCALLSSLSGLKWPFYFRKKPVKVTYKSIPKFKNISPAKSVGGFFYKCYGRKNCASYLWKNKKRKKILSINSRLTLNQKEVISEFIYRDMDSFIECVKTYNQDFPSSSDPVNHKIINIAV